MAISRHVPAVTIIIIFTPLLNSQGNEKNYAMQYMQSAVALNTGWRHHTMALSAKVYERKDQPQLYVSESTAVLSTSDTAAAFASRRATPTTLSRASIHSEAQKYETATTFD